MEQKKSEKANLQTKKFIFLEIGLVLTLLAVWCVFEFNTKAENSAAYNQLAALGGDDEIIEIPVTHPEPPQPPAPPAPKLPEIIEIVGEDVDPEEFTCASEVDPNSSVDIQEIPVISCPDDEIAEGEVPPIVFCEVMPEFKGNLLKYVAEHVEYPEICKDNDIQGTVFVGFVVDEKGKVTDVTILRGIDPLLDKAAMKVVQNLPAWKPGMQSGRNVKVRMNMPIKFQLAN